MGLILDFAIINITLHQEGLLSLIAFQTSLLNQISLVTEDQSRDHVASTRSKRELVSIQEDEGDVQKTVKKREWKIYFKLQICIIVLFSGKKRKSKVVETIKFKLLAELQEVAVKFATDKSNISLCAIRGIVSNIIVKDSYTQVRANLQEIAVMDLNPDSLHKLVRPCFFLYFTNDTNRNIFTSRNCFYRN